MEVTHTTSGGCQQSDEGSDMAQSTLGVSANGIALDFNW